jgi:hypothetical protein
MPARPRYWVSASFAIPFRAVYSPTSSCGAKVTRWPSRDRAFEVTVSTRPPPGRRMNSSPVFGMMSPSGPSSIIGRSASYVFSVESSDTAVIWMSGVLHAMPIGSPGLYGYSQPHGQPWALQA